MTRIRFLALVVLPVLLCGHAVPAAAAFDAPARGRQAAHPDAATTAHTADPGGTSAATHDLVSGAVSLPAPALMGSEGSLRVIAERGTGQAGVRTVRRAPHTTLPGPATSRVPRVARCHAPSPLDQAGLPAWSTTTPPPSPQR